MDEPPVSRPVFGSPPTPVRDVPVLQPGDRPREVPERPGRRDRRDHPSVSQKPSRSRRTALRQGPGGDGVCVCVSAKVVSRRPLPPTRDVGERRGTPPVSRGAVRGRPLPDTRPPSRCLGSPTPPTGPTPPEVPGGRGAVSVSDPGGLPPPPGSRTQSLSLTLVFCVPSWPTKKRKNILKKRNKNKLYF